MSLKCYYLIFALVFVAFAIERIEATSIDRIQKRGIGSFFDRMFGRNKNESSTTSTTTTTTTTKTTLTTNPKLEIINDPFFILRNMCQNDSFTEICRVKKYNLSSIVQKCDQIDKDYRIEACKEAVSIYCYVYSKQDSKICLTHKYDEYVPGKKNFTSKANTTTTTTKAAIYDIVTTKNITNSSKFDKYYDDLREKCRKNVNDTYCKARKADMLSTIEKCKFFNSTCDGLISFYCYIFPNSENYCSNKTTTTTTTSGRLTSNKTTNLATITTTKETDVFLRLKTQCSKQMTEECKQRKATMYDLVVKCDDLSTNIASALSACREIISVYCYLFATQDTKTCTTHKYHEYRPSSNDANSTKSYKSTTSLLYPFERLAGFDGTIRKIPENASDLKEIGNYCLRVQQDKNCDQLLALMRSMYKSCEKRPASDKDCQQFKRNICSAFETFPGCGKIQKLNESFA